MEAKAKSRKRGPARLRYAIGVALGVAIATLAVVALVSGDGDGDGQSAPAGADDAAETSPDATPQYTPSRYQPTASDTLFSPQSFWNRPVPNDARLAPDSDAMVGGLLEEVAREQEARTGPWIASGSFSTPIYEVPKDQSTVKVTLNGEHGDGHSEEALQEAFEEVPIPRDAAPADGTDSHMVIWQPSTDRMWEFWQAREEGGEWQASWGGAIQDVSEFPGYYTVDAWPGARHSWAATATGLPVAGGVMLVDELQSGEVDHALALNLPFPRAGEYSWPAQDADGTGPPDAIPEGARLRLDPDFDVDTIEHPVVRAMAEAAQEYGIVVRDRTGSVIAFAAEDAAQAGEDPYRDEATGAGLWQDQYPTEFLSAFPWKHLQVLELHLCANEVQPCPPPPEFQ
jgi:hypothetical protein